MNKTKRTPFSFCQSKERVLSEPLRKKIRAAFHKKLRQFESCKPIFWVIDCKEWEYDITEVKRAFYGDAICTNKTVLELYNDPCLDPVSSLPTLMYTPKMGLFFLNEAECLRVD